MASPVLLSVTNHLGRIVADITVSKEMSTNDEIDGHKTLVSIDPTVTRQAAVAIEYEIVDVDMRCSSLPEGSISSSCLLSTLPGVAR